MIFLFQSGNACFSTSFDLTGITLKPVVTAVSSFVGMDECRQISEGRVPGSNQRRGNIVIVPAHVRPLPG